MIGLCWLSVSKTTQNSDAQICICQKKDLAQLVPGFFREKLAKLAISSILWSFFPRASSNFLLFPLFGCSPLELVSHRQVFAHRSSLKRCCHTALICPVLITGSVFACK